MKRFFCTVCKRVKRVRKLPLNVAPDTLSDVMPDARVGSCDWHTVGRIIPLRQNKSIRRVVVQSVAQSNTGKKSNKRGR